MEWVSMWGGDGMGVGVCVGIDVCWCRLCGGWVWREGKKVIDKQQVKIRSVSVSEIICVIINVSCLLVR